MGRVSRVTRAVAGILVVAFLAASCVTYVPMVEGESVRTERRIAERAYFQTDDRVEPNSIATVLEQDYTTARYARLYQNRMLAFGVLSLAGSIFALTGMIINMVSDAPLAGVGITLTGVGFYLAAFPFSGLAHRSLSEGVEVYNEALLSP